MQPAAIGPFRIERELGHGGMGVVYLARDTRLDRLVAIKALPAHLAQDPDRLARFQREAKVLASLNDPGIAAIYGLEEAGGHQYLILEFVEGETLADRLARGPVPLDEALHLARRIAEALEVAHEKGIVHRDLKPGNVMVTVEGATKVLDFGLARTAEGALSPSASDLSPADSPTITSPARYAHSPTIPGVIMGTAGYMSPEQARGRPVDKRTDIFSFGCLLYEMLTGSQPFRGESVADSIGATLHKETDLGQLPPQTPRRVRDLLRNCLVKDRRHRLHDIGDARIELERAIAEPHDREPLAVVRAAAPWWRSAGVLVTLSLLALAGIAAAVVATRERPASARPSVVRATLAFPRGLTISESSRDVAVSPDGAQVAMTLRPKDGNSPSMLYLRDLSRLEYRALAGTDGAIFPFWSPDGRSLGFFADRKLKRIDLADGIVRVLCDAPSGRGASWGTKQTIVFAPSAGGGLMLVSDAGGTPTPVTTTTSPSQSHRLPQMLPDGERFLYYAREESEYGSVRVYDPATKQSRELFPGWSEAWFVEPATIVFTKDEHLYAQGFDARKLELTGTPRPIAADVYYSKTRAYINGGISARGTLVYELLSPPARQSLAWMDRTGGRTMLPAAPQPISTDGARLSKDGRRAAISLSGSRDEQSVAVLDLERGVRTPIGDPSLTFSWGNVWGPGDESIITSEQRGTRRNLVSLQLNGGASAPFHDVDGGVEIGPCCLTPDGKEVVFTQQTLREKLPDVFIIGLDRSAPARRFLQTPEGEWNPVISPAGDLISFDVVGDEDATTVNLRVATYPVPAAPVQVSPTSTLFSAHWWIAPGELAWIDASRRLWSATLTAKGGRVEVGAPKPMLDGKPLDSRVRILDYDLPRDRFLIAIDDETKEDPRLIIVNDWRQDAGAMAGP